MKNIEIYSVKNKPIKLLETLDYQLCAVGKIFFLNNNFQTNIHKPLN